MAPIFEEMSNSSEFDILRIDVDDNQEFAKENNIQGVPVTYIYKGKDKIATLNGYASKDMILEQLK
jgi:thioredoxin-like negative regulator of GroEL